MYFMIYPLFFWLNLSRSKVAVFWQSQETMPSQPVEPYVKIIAAFNFSQLIDFKLLKTACQKFHQNMAQAKSV